MDRIKMDGPISFKEFMNMSLYDPDYGYYTSPDTEIGCGGDFYTSAHLHAIFGAMIGKQIEEMWSFMKEPSEFYIVEIGAGKGYLASDMLNYLRKKKFFEALRYMIIEINPTMKKNQEKMLKPFIEKVAWIPSLHEIRNLTGCILSNELIDSFPVHLIQVDGHIVKEIFVDVRKDDFYEMHSLCGPEILDYTKEFEIPLLDGYRTEVNLLIKEWLKEVSQVLQEGFILTIDYGYPSWDYYAPQRRRGTLLCFYQHKVNENPYQHTGKQDITAHVNFSALKKWGEEYGLRAICYCPQGTFLVSLRMDDVLNEIQQDDCPFEISKIKGLILPEGMGESHKVLIQYKGEGIPELMGFSLRNNLAKL